MWVADPLALPGGSALLISRFLLMSMNVMLPNVLKTTALLMLVLSVSCTSTAKRQQAQAHYKIGASHLNTGSVQSAYIEFQKARDLDPRNKEILNALGIVYLRLEDLKKAEELFSKAVGEDSVYSEAHNNLCFVYLRMERWEDAVKSCKRALKNPLYATPDKAFYNIGLAYFKLGRLDEAAKAFNDALLRQPLLYHAYYGLALANNAKKLYGDAASAMAKAIELDPRFKGSRRKAEEEFSRPGASPEQKDYRDYLEILRY